MNSFKHVDIDSQKGQLVDKLNSAHYSTGRVAASLTSTAFDVSTKQQSEILDEYTVKYKYVKKKGYARLVTNYGDLNLELFCQVVLFIFCNGKNDLIVEIN